jgi:hypothetical protein
MQIHGPNDEADGSKFAARLNAGTDHPFAVVEMGQVQFFIDTPEECDAAIRVWVEAKRLLLGGVEDLLAFPDLCPASTDLDGDTFYCDRDRGHDGSHHGYGPGEGSEVAWSDELAEGDCPAVPPSGPGYICTLATGHEGPHKAGGPRGQVYATWTDAPGVIAGDFGAEIVNGGAK